MNRESITPTPNVIPVPGAFEIFEGNREELTTLTRTGQLLQPGDILPTITGVRIVDRPFVIHTVNAFGTETCDECTDEVESFHIAHPEIPVYSLTKQSAQEIAAEDAKRSEAGKPPVTHRRITVSDEIAVDLGVALSPGEGADEEFWPTALRRTLAYIGADGRVVDIQQPDDQEEIPDITRLYEKVESTKEQTVKTEKPREFIKFRDDEQASTLTIEALTNVGFEVETDPSKIDTQRFRVFSGSRPELTAIYTNLTTGIRVEASIRTYDVEDGQYDWMGRVVGQDGSDHLYPLAGNHDNSQHEFKAILTNMLACAEFNLPSEKLPKWTEQYKDWERSIDEQLSPLNGEVGE